MRMLCTFQYILSIFQKNLLNYVEIGFTIDMQLMMVK
jgi:hypothetical protein